MACGSRESLVVSGMVAIIAVVLYKTVVPAGCTTATDAPWYDIPKLIAPHVVTNYTSRYVTMPDGVRLAVDLHLPLQWSNNDAPLPTILHFTRYNRNWRTRWPMSLLIGPYFNLRTSRYLARFIPAGYAWVSVDVRGTGASFGYSFIHSSLTYMCVSFYLCVTYVLLSRLIVVN
jgi:predicted acyl esterase